VRAHGDRLAAEHALSLARRDEGNQTLTDALMSNVVNQPSSLQSGLDRLEHTGKKREGSRATAPIKNRPFAGLLAVTSARAALRIFAG
jgi:hypothetical protein